VSKTVEVEVTTHQTQTPKLARSSLMSRLAKNKFAFASFWFLITIHIIAFFGPYIWTVPPDQINPAAALSGWTLQNPLGADDIGRDILSRMIHGGRVTLIVGFASMLFSVTLGVIIGACAGFYGRWVEAVLMRLTESMMAIPNFFFVLVALTVLGKSPLMVIIVIALSSWMETARVVYGETLKWKSYEFVEAAVASGASSLRVLAKYILPQTYPTIIVAGTLGIAWAILTESAISYLGLGIQPPTATWGNMLQNAQQYIWTSPVLGIIPGIAITLVVLAYNFLGDGLRDALDPRHVKKSE
jgi:peptide/nickel transport system permease protein